MVPSPVSDAQWRTTRLLASRSASSVVLMSTPTRRWLLTPRRRASKDAKISHGQQQDFRDIPFTLEISGNGIPDKDAGKMGTETCTTGPYFPGRRWRGGEVQVEVEDKGAHTIQFLLET